MADIPHFDVVVSAENYKKEFMVVLQKIRPHWKENEIVFKQSPKTVDRGLLNTMVRCYSNDNKDDDAIMLRVLNVAMGELMNRAVEVACIKYLQPRDCAPTILATFKTGYCYKFINGEILSHERLREDPIWRRIAEEFAKIHAANIDEIPGFAQKMTFLEIVDKCEEAFPDELKDPKKNERKRTVDDCLVGSLKDYGWKGPRFYLDQTIMSLEGMKKELPDKATLKKETDEALAHALSFEPDQVLTHNDTRAENIIWNKDTGLAKFVDFEGVIYNYRAWELAAHFQRFGGIDPVDFSLFPDEDFQLAWLRVYLEKYFEMTGRSRSDVTDLTVRRLHVHVQKFHLVGLIMMGLGGPVFENMNVLPDNQLDMIGFAIEAVKSYFEAKERIFALQMPDENE